MTGPSVPELPEGVTLSDAALAYADHGWYVLPIDAADKRPGSKVGKGWPEKSSRDPETIAGWWRRWPDAGIALHVGRSGAVAFDVDRPAAMPEVLREAIADREPAFASTDTTDPERGHYLFRAGPGRFGNSGGALGSEWGEVRGLNGVIVVEPTPHTRAGGQYRWKRTGLLSEPTAALSGALRPPGSARRGTVPSFEADVFLESLPDRERCDAVAAVEVDMPAAGRHEAMTRAVLTLVRFGEQGHHGAGAALDDLREAFVAAVEGDRRGGEAEALDEYERALHGAIAEVQAEPTPEGDRGCCDYLRDADTWAGLGVDVEAHERRLAELANPGRVLDPSEAASPASTAPSRRAQRLHGCEVDVSAFGRELPPPPAWLLPDLVREGDLVSLSAAAKAGKSLLTLDRVLAAVVNDGRRVIYLDAEDGFRDTHQRVHALGYDDADLARWHYVAFPALVLDDEAGARELLGYVQDITDEHGRPDLVVLNTASRFVGGEENDASTWLALYRLTLLPLKRAGIAVLRVDHLGKDGDRGPRGSSAKSGDVDAEITLSAHPGPEPTDPARVVLRCPSGGRSGTYAGITTLVRGTVEGVLGHRHPGEWAGGAVIVDRPDDEAERIVKALDTAGAPISVGREALVPHLPVAEFPTTPTKRDRSEAVRRRKARDHEADPGREYREALTACPYPGTAAGQTPMATPYDPGYKRPAGGPFGGAA